IRNPQTGVPEDPPRVPLPNWTQREERAAIKVENAVAKANGEPGDRDSHGYAGFFFTDNITSTTPVDPLQKSIIEHFEPQLRTQTQLIDQLRTLPGNLHEPIPATRAHTTETARDFLDLYGNMSVINEMISSGKSPDEIATELQLTAAQKEMVKNMFSPPPQP
ncbi:MAG TPA: hypothetical protein VNV63_05535, partial [Nitrospiria bacterium]|nr:hypothetical protein [Nitrospiria bacterium]